MHSFTDNQLPTPQETQTPFFANSDHVADAPLLPPSPPAYANHSTSWTPVDAMTPISTNPSHKRSRDKTAFQDDGESPYFPSQQVNTPAPIPEEEPIYGEGMVLLNPRTGLSVSAESQTGTWYEEKTETDLRNPDTEIRPRMPTRKSVRMDSSVPLPRMDDIAAAVAPPSPTKTIPDQPEIDDFTIALGIGWTKIASGDPDTQAATRGWARYIENHYARHIHGAEILSKSKGLNAYLVRCQEGFFLFTDDLSEGRMVASSWDVCIHNLRVHPTIYEGQDILRAERTPVPDMVSENGLKIERFETGDDESHSNGVGQYAVTSHDGMEID